MSLESIRALVGCDLEASDRYIISQLESNTPFIRQMLEYVLSAGGKRVRPMILLLAARALSHHKPEHITLAAVIELIHTATLLHDDVVDTATLRRGHKTAHTIWGADASVLVGDFLYSRAFQSVVMLGQQRIMEVFASATHFMAEGEILQLTNRHNPETTEAFYYDIIYRKTAKLFEISAKLGAIVASSQESDIQAFHDYGLHLGFAYQLIDDALDYATSADETGKNIGQDLSDGKCTLPLIHAIHHSKGKNKDLLCEAVQTGSVENMQTILGIIESTDAIKYTAEAAKRHATKAKEALKTLAFSPYRTALESLCDFVVARNY